MTDGDREPLELSYAAVLPPLPNSRLAIISLVCGFAGLAAVLFSPIFMPIGITGLITGLAARKKSLAEPNFRPRRHWIKIAIALNGTSIVLATVILLLFVQKLSRIEELRNRSACQTHMKAIGAALLAYQNQFGAELYTLEEWSELLIATGAVSPSQFDCPSCKGCGGECYRFTPVFEGDDPATTPVLSESAKHHGDEGWNVLYADWHVSFTRQSNRKRPSH